MVLQSVNSEFEMLNLVKRCRLKWELTERESYSKEKGDEEKNRSVLLFEYVHFSAAKRKVRFVKGSHLWAIATITTSINGVASVHCGRLTHTLGCVRVYRFMPGFLPTFSETLHTTSSLCLTLTRCFCWWETAVWEQQVKSVEQTGEIFYILEQYIKNIHTWTI